MFEALRVRDFRWLWTGGSISSLGSWLLVLAVPAHLYVVTGSLAKTGPGCRWRQHICRSSCSARSRARWPTGGTGAGS
jgi:hypothetical protein